MPKVTFSNDKGILQEAGTGFQVNDAPILQEIEAISDSAEFTVTVNESGDTTSDLNNKYFYIADASDSQWYVWLNVDAAGVDPDPDDGDTTAIAVAISEDDAKGTVATAIAAAIDAETEFTSAAAAEVVTVSCLEVGPVKIGNVRGGDNLIKNGNLEDLGAGENEDFAIALVDNAAGSSALEVFGVTNLAQANANGVVGTATLAATTAGTKKLVVLPAAPGAGSSVVVTYVNGTGGNSTLTFDGAAEYAYLLSNGTGWVKLKAAAGV